MQARALIEHQAALLRAVLRLEHPADRVVAEFFRQHRMLGSRERYALAETTYEVLRRLSWWRHLAQGGPGPLERRLAVLAWQGDPRSLPRELDDATSAWWQQARAARGLGPAAAVGDASLRHHLPVWLAEALQPGFDPAEFEAMALALAQPAPLDLRVNTLRTRPDAVRTALQASGVDCAATRWSPWGLRVQGKPSLAGLGPLERGEVEVQDEGSQLLALLTGAGRGEIVVDFCAGGGGKTLALGAMMRNTGRLYAFDTSDLRLAGLRPRLERSGLSNVHATCIAHEQDNRVRRLHGKVDRVLVDAPCSGLGTVRRHPDLKWRHAQEALPQWPSVQRVILESAARLLRPGGRLVYATCSLLPQENEEVARAFTSDRRAEFEPVDAAEVLRQARVDDASLLCQGGFLSLWPHRHGTDGFFAAIWRRR